jgi:hypothetical protein
MAGPQQCPVAVRNNNLCPGKEKFHMENRKIVLPESELPRQWYNVLPDLPTPLEPDLHPGTGQPVGPDDLAPIFPMQLIEQEVSQERYIDIPEEVLEKYLIWRPTPLYRAYGLEKHLETPARIYFKNEGVSPAGSHKPNTALAQAYYNKISGDRCRPVGKRLGLLLFTFRSGMQGLYGESQLRAKAL